MNLSIIIPTLNEENNVDQIIPLLKVNRNIQIIVADSPQSSDDTEKVCLSHQVLYLNCKVAGRAGQMNEGSKHAIYDTLFFVHSDVVPPQNFILDIEETISKKFKAGFFNYRFDSESVLLKINSFFTGFDGIFAGGGDQTLFIRKDTFDALEGYNEDYGIMEDFDLVRKIKKKKISYRLVKNPLTVSARKYQKNSYLRVNLTNLVLIILFNTGVKPEKLSAVHKLLIKT